MKLEFSKKDVSIIIVNYNTKSLLKNCLNSIISKTKELNYEIIVVDNNSNDGSQKMIMQDFINNQKTDITVKLITNERNIGFGKANNVGVKYADGRYVFLLNPDTILLNNAIKILFDFMKKSIAKNIAVCGASIFDENLKPGISYGHFPTPLNHIFYAIPIGIKKNIGILKKRELYKDHIYVDYVSGATFFIDKSLFETIGGFDANFFAYYEETDLSFRLYLKGYRSVILPKAKIIHLVGQSFKKNPNKEIIFLNSLMYYFYKWYKCKFTFKLFCKFMKLKFNLYKIINIKSYASECLKIIKKYELRVRTECQ